MEITRKGMESLAKELNKVLGLEPQIDIKQTSDEELRKQLIMAGTIVVPGQDPISDKGMDLLAALSSGDKTTTNKEEPMNNELLERIESAKKLSELKLIAQEMNEDIQKLAAEAKGLQAAQDLKKSMIAAATWTESPAKVKGAKKAPKAEAEETPKTPKKSKKASAEVEETPETTPAKKAKKAPKAAVEETTEVEVEETPIAPEIESLRTDKSFANMKKIWKGSEVLQGSITLKELNATKEDPKLIGKMRKKMIGLLSPEETTEAEAAPTKKTKKAPKTESTGSRSNPKYGKATRELYVKLADMIKEGKHDKNSITNTLVKQFGVDPKKVGFLLSFAKNPQHTRCGVVAVIDSKGIFKLSKEKALRPLKAAK